MLHIWIKAARLRTLPLSASGVILGGAVAASEGAFRPAVFALSVLTALLLFSHVQYTVLNGEVASLRSQMTKLQSDNATLSAQYEKVFDLDTIQNTVGDAMVRPTGDQVVYIDLSEPDSVVLYGQEEGQGGLSGAIQSVKTIVGDMIEYFR